MTASEADPTPLSEAAYRQIRADIISCRLTPGGRFTERGLAADHGLGVSPVRDALIRLDHEGLVRTLPRRGYQVKPLTIKSVDDLFDCWAILGPGVARQGIAGVTAEQLDGIVASGDRLTALATDLGPREVTRHSNEIFHQTFAILAEATRNDYLITVVGRLSGELSRVWMLVVDSGLLDRAEPVTAGSRWKDPILKRDGDAVADLLRDYLRRSHHQVLRTLARWPSVIETEVVPLGGDVR